MAWLDRLAARLSAVGEAVAALGVAAMALVLGLEAVLRKLGRPQGWADDSVALLVLYSAFLGLAMAERRGEHMRVDSLLNRLGRRTRAGVELAHGLLGVGVAAVVVVTGTQVVAASVRLGKLHASSLEYPLAWSQAAVPLGALLLGVELVLRVGRLARAVGNPA